MAIEKVGIFGLGTMGHGIAIVTVQAGYEVIVTEANKELLDALPPGVEPAYDGMTIAELRRFLNVAQIVGDAGEPLHAALPIEHRVDFFRTHASVEEEEDDGW